MQQLRLSEYNYCHDAIASGGSGDNPVGVLQPGFVDPSVPLISHLPPGSFAAGRRRFPAPLLFGKTFPES